MRYGPWRDPLGEPSRPVVSLADHRPAFLAAAQPHRDLEMVRPVNAATRLQTGKRESCLAVPNDVGLDQDLGAPTYKLRTDSPIFHKSTAVKCPSTHRRKVSGGCQRFV